MLVESTRAGVRWALPVSRVGKILGGSVRGLVPGLALILALLPGSASAQSGRGASLPAEPCVEGSVFTRTAYPRGTFECKSAAWRPAIGNACTSSEFVKGNGACGTGGAGGGAPTDATYITQTSNSGLSAEQALASLSTGIVKVTTGTGVLSTAVAGDFPTLNQSTSGNAGTASALAADPSDCTGNNFALGVNATGTASCAQPAFSNLSGTATDAQLASNYSGVGACGANTWASTLNDNAAPTCTQPAFSNLSGSATDAQIPDSITVTLASTATALAANGANCSGNNFALGVDASGVGECAQPAFSNLSGAATDAQVPDNITVTLAGTATALAADPADCTGSNFATGINASGVAQCSTPPGTPTTLTSTATQSDAVVATYTAITGLSFTPAANTNYYIDCFLIYTSTAATTGISYAWDVPTGATIHAHGTTTTTATGGTESIVQRADATATTTANAIITVENVMLLHARLKNGANATSTTLGFTPETANSVSSITGSTCQYWTY